MPATPKTPQDHLTKKAKSKAGEHTPFTFTHDDVEYSLKPLATLGTGFIRKNRRRTDIDALFTMLEALVDDDPKHKGDTLTAIDEMDREEFNQLQDDFNKHNGVTPGE